MAQTPTPMPSIARHATVQFAPGMKPKTNEMRRIHASPKPMAILRPYRCAIQPEMIEPQNMPR